MKDFIDILSVWSPILATILLAFYIIIELYKESNTIRNAFLKLLGFFKKLLNSIRTANRNYFNRVLASEDYLKWQNEVLFYIYDNYVNKTNGQIEYANIFHRKYEAIIIPSNKVLNYPFKGICNKDDLEYFLPCNKKGVVKEKYFKFRLFKDIKKHRWLVFKYRRLIKATIHSPNLLGYMLKELEINADGIKVTSLVRTYNHNLYTSHILEYELYKLYKKYPLIRHSIDNKKEDHTLYLIEGRQQEFLAKYLPLRASITKACGDKVLTSGNGRYSLLGVQIFVICKNINDGYDVLRIRRSSKVSAKANYLQFIPSGGFESLNNEKDLDSQYINYSLSKAVFREFIEECFGNEEFEYNNKKNASPESVYANEGIIEIIEGIKKGINSFEFIGSTMSLTALRQELSFLLVINDPSFSARLLANDEAMNAVQLVSLNVLEKESFWNKQISTKLPSDIELLNCTSAGLWALVKKTKTYQDLLNKTKKVNN